MLEVMHRAERLKGTTLGTLEEGRNLDERLGWDSVAGVK